MATTDKYIEIPLSDLYIDPTWNARSGVGENLNEEGIDDDENTDAGLLKSIELKGQDTPVFVWQTPKDFKVNDKKVKEPYMLVSGHRRAWAIETIAKKSGNKNPTIKALVKPIQSVAEARMLNLRENTDRESLTPSDLCFGIAEHIAANPQATASSVAADLGLSQPYVSRLFAIIEKVKPTLIKKWRDQTGTQFSVDQMVTIAKKDKNEQDAAYAELLRARQSREAEGTGADHWIETQKKKAETFGGLFGRLAKNGLVNIDPEKFFFDALPFYVKTKGGKKNEEMADRVKHSVAGVAYKGFMAEYEADDDTEGETSEEAAAKNGTRKAARNAAAKELVS